MSNHSRKLVEQQHALDDFFASLLHDVQNYAEREFAGETALPVPQPIIAAPELPPVQYDIPPQPLRLPLPPVAPPIIESQQGVLAAPPEVVSAAAVPEMSPAVEIPAWTQHPFQALLFKVAGLTLAVPLVELNGILEWHVDAVTEMPGHADFYLGLLPHLGKNVALIDTARFVLPTDRINDLVGDQPHQRLTRIVLIHDGRYGLACDEVAEVITLQPQDVRWRTSRTQRRWLAGTVVAHMCALIDTASFAQMLADKLPVKAFRE